MLEVLVVCISADLGRIQLLCIPHAASELKMAYCFIEVLHVPPVA